MFKVQHTERSAPKHMHALSLLLAPHSDVFNQQIHTFCKSLCLMRRLLPTSLQCHLKGSWKKILRPSGDHLQCLLWPTMCLTVLYLIKLTGFNVIKCTFFSPPGLQVSIIYFISPGRPNMYVNLVFVYVFVWTGVFSKSSPGVFKILYLIHFNICISINQH